MTRTVLIIEDELEVAASFKDALTEHGFEVVVAADGESGLDDFADSAFDAVVLDVQLPRIQGFDLLPRLRKLPGGERVPVVMVSEVFRGDNYAARMEALHDITAYMHKPVDPQQLTAVLRAQFEGPSAGQLSAVLPTTSASRPRLDEPPALTASLEGDLETIPFARVFGGIYSERLTGALMLRKSSVKKLIYFHDGLPIFVKSNLLHECLGRIMVAERLITQDECDRSLARKQIEPHKRQGELLVEMGFISPHNLDFGLELQMQAKLFDVFSWLDGRYQFNNHVEFDGEQVRLSMGPAQLIYEGASRSMSTERIRRDLAFTREWVLVPSHEPSFRYQALQLDPRADRFLNRIDGTRSVEQLLACGELDEADAALILYSLVCTSLVRVAFGSSGPYPVVPVAPPVSSISRAEPAVIPVPDAATAAIASDDEETVARTVVGPRGLHIPRRYGEGGEADGPAREPREPRESPEPRFVGRDVTDETRQVRQALARNPDENPLSTIDDAEWANEIDAVLDRSLAMAMMPHLARVGGAYGFRQVDGGPVSEEVDGVEVVIEAPIIADEAFDSEESLTEDLLVEPQPFDPYIDDEDYGLPLAEPIPAELLMETPDSASSISDPGPASVVFQIPELKDWMTAEPLPEDLVLEGRVPDFDEDDTIAISSDVVLLPAAQAEHHEREPEPLPESVVFAAPVPEYFYGYPPESSWAHVRGDEVDFDTDFLSVYAPGEVDFDLNKDHTLIGARPTDEPDDLGDFSDDEARDETGIEDFIAVEALATGDPSSGAGVDEFDVIDDIPVAVASADVDDEGPLDALIVAVDSGGMDVASAAPKPATVSDEALSPASTGASGFIDESGELGRLDSSLAGAEAGDETGAEMGPERAGTGGVSADASGDVITSSPAGDVDDVEISSGEAAALAAAVVDELTRLAARAGAPQMADPPDASAVEAQANAAADPEDDFEITDAGVEVELEAPDAEPNVEATSERLTADPATVDPVTVDPVTVDPVAVDPVTVDPVTVDPVAVDPVANELSAAEPSAMEPSAVEPSVSEASAAVGAPDAAAVGAPDAAAVGAPDAAAVGAPDAAAVGAPDAAADAAAEDQLDVDVDVDVAAFEVDVEFAEPNETSPEVFEAASSPLPASVAEPSVAPPTQPVNDAGAAPSEQQASDDRVEPRPAALVRRSSMTGELFSRTAFEPTLPPPTTTFVPPDRTEERRKLERELALRLERLAELTHYEVLEVAPEADETEIQAARARLESQFHPDRWTPDRLTARARRLTEQSTLLVRRAADQLLSRAERIRYDRAIGVATRPPQADPFEAELAFQLGRSAADRDDVSEAEAHFRQAIAYAPADGEYLAALAEILLTREAWEEATDLLDRAIELSPRSRTVSLARARLHRRQAHESEALDWYTRVLKLDPDCREAREFLAAQDRLFVRRTGLLSRLTKV